MRHSAGFYVKHVVDKTIAADAKLSVNKDGGCSISFRKVGIKRGSLFDKHDVLGTANISRYIYNLMLFQTLPEVVVVQDISWMGFARQL